jgi:hypothetical protein
MAKDETKEVIKEEVKEEKKSKSKIDDETTAVLEKIKSGLNPSELSLAEQQLLYTHNLNVGK